jgi:hypothetical protein
LTPDVVDVEDAPLPHLRHRHARPVLQPGDQCYDFKNNSAKKWRTNCQFLHKLHTTIDEFNVFQENCQFFNRKKSSTPENGSQNKTVPELAMIDLSWLFWLLKHFLYLTPSG